MRNHNLGWLVKLLIGVLVFITPLVIVFAVTRIWPRALAEEQLPAVPATDPALVKYHEAHTIPTGFSEPRAIALGSDGALYAAGDLEIVRLRESGERTRIIALTAPPCCLAVDAEGLFYIGLKDHVEVYDSHGRLQSRWTIPGKSAYFTSIAISGNTVWVADAGSRLVWKYDRTGKLMTSIGRKDQRTGAPGFVVPSPHMDVAVARDGTLWVSNPGRHALENFTGDSSLRRTWGTTGNTVAAFSGCCNPTDFALLPDGRFVTAEKKLPRVKIYRADGTFDGFVAGSESFAAKIEGMDLAVGAHGQVFVLDTERKSVRVFEPNVEKMHE